MTVTGAMGITSVFLADAANLPWIPQPGGSRLVAADRDLARRGTGIVIAALRGRHVVARFDAGP